jgi:hypothetical protein
LKASAYDSPDGVLRGFGSPATMALYRETNMASTHFIHASAANADYRLAETASDISLSPHDRASSLMAEPERAKGCSVTDSSCTMPLPAFAASISDSGCAAPE